jgi:hypothetical protein
VSGVVWPLLYAKPVVARRSLCAALAAVAGLATGARSDVPADDDTLASSRRLSSRNDILFLSISDMSADELASRDVRVSIALPVIRGGDFGFGVIPRYTATWIDPDVNGAHDLVLHRFDLLAGGGGRVAPAWWIRGALGATYASDLDGTSASSQALQVTALATVRHNIGANDAWTLGAVYSSSADILPVLPVVGYVHQRPGSRFRFDALLPHHARVVYDVAPGWQAAIGVETFSDVWVGHAMSDGFVVRREGGAAFAEIDAAIGRVHVEWRTGLALARYGLPAPMTDDSHPHGIGPSVFVQLLATVLP